MKRLKGHLIDLGGGRAAMSLSLAAPSTPVKEFLIWSGGEVDTEKGVFLFDDAAAASVMANFATYDNDLMVDYDHASLSFLQVDPSESAKAAGWFRPELRGSELWAANVTWTPKAAQKLADREFRYFSPAFGLEGLKFDEDGNVQDDGPRRIDRLVNIALTNMPATRSMTPLAASLAAAPPEPQENNAMKTLFALLMLSATATEAEACAAVTRTMDERRQLLEATGQTTVAAALGVLAAQRDAVTQLATARGEIVALRGASTEVTVRASIARAKAEGKITPAMEPVVLAQALKDPAFLEGFLSVAPVVVKPGQVIPPAGAADVDVTLTAEELAICTQTGAKPEVFLAAKKARLAAKK